MGFASQAYESPTGLYGPSSTFQASSAGNLPKTSTFFKAFGNGPTNSRGVEQPQQSEKQINRRPSLGITPNDQSFFDFDPPSNTGSPFHNRTQFDTPSGIPGWGSDMDFRPLSPPDSASPFSREWNYGFSNMPNQPSSNGFNNAQSSHGARAHYGQVTPPDDENDDELLLEQQLRDQQEEHREGSPSKKRKRGNASQSKESFQSTPKRRRKTNLRSAVSSKALDSSKPEDVRRSKFLERNRVAASKCRQKKKEWTQNLEDRGRNFQKENANLRILVDSLRQEALFLKGEMLRHSECDSPQIDDYLKSGAASMMPDVSTTESVMQRRSSPFEEVPESIGTTDLDGQSVFDDDDDVVAHQQSQTNAAIAEDENALEALLTRSINHDNASEEGIAERLQH